MIRSSGKGKPESIQVQCLLCFPMLCLLCQGVKGTGQDAAQGWLQLVEQMHGQCYLLLPAAAPGGGPGDPEVWAKGQGWV